MIERGRFARDIGRCTGDVMAHQRACGHRRMVGVIAVAVTLLASCSSTPAQDDKPATTTSVSSGKSAAVRSILEAFFANDYTDMYRNRRALLVSVGDDLLVEDYHESSATTKINIQSMGKSIMSTLIGIALSEGRLKSVDQTLAELLPSSAAVMSSKTKRITLQQVLTMSAGLPPDDVFYPEVIEESNWVQYILANGPATTPGEKFEYSSAGSHLLSAILRQATGMSTLEYAREKLFEPTGIPTTPDTKIVAQAKNIKAYDNAAGFVWPMDPQGVHVGGGGQKLTARDMLTLGRLWLNGGRWKGSQVAPQEWMNEATRPRVKTGFETAPGYGYQFWIVEADDHAAFAAFGYGGQLVEVVPDQGLVVVVLSTSPSDPTVAAEPGTAQPENYVHMVDQLIAPAIG
jgi:CubicO group peptidase (beta-lactamase class C family)